MCQSLRSEPRRRAARRLPAYPRHIGAGLLLIATACGGSSRGPNTVGPDGMQQPAGATTPTNTIATDPGGVSPVAPGPPDPAHLGGEAPAPYVEGD